MIWTPNRLLWRFSVRRRCCFLFSYKIDVCLYLITLQIVGVTMPSLILYLPSHLSDDDHVWSEQRELSSDSYQIRSFTIAFGMRTNLWGKCDQLRPFFLPPSHLQTAEEFRYSKRSYSSAAILHLQFSEQLLTFAGNSLTWWTQQPDADGASDKSYHK